jgi:hypothetical protein
VAGRGNPCLHANPQWTASTCNQAMPVASTAKIQDSSKLNDFCNTGRVRPRIDGEKDSAVESGWVQAPLVSGHVNLTASSASPCK